MEIRDLQFFCLTAELGSVTKASEQLQVSQPFVTKVIHQLENELGTKLFDLENRRLKLNENGTYFYKKAREILDKFDRLGVDMAARQEHAQFTTTLLYNNAGYLSALYQDAIFDTKKKALPGVELPKRAKNKDFQQILGLLEVLFRYAIVWQVVTEVTGHAAY